LRDVQFDAYFRRFASAITRIWMSDLAIPT